MMPPPPPPRQPKKPHAATRLRHAFIQEASRVYCDDADNSLSHHEPIEADKEGLISGNGPAETVAHGHDRVEIPGEQADEGYGNDSHEGYESGTQWHVAWSSPSSTTAPASSTPSAYPVSVECRKAEVARRERRPCQHGGEQHHEGR